jgi:hypothetical protein
MIQILLTDEFVLIPVWMRFANQVHHGRAYRLAKHNILFFKVFATNLAGNVFVWNLWNRSNHGTFKE